jgi:putative FmdB family regulatory protein
MPERALMPTYQYRCTECGHDLEAVQKFSDATLTECPNCGGSLRKVFNAVGVVFKGSGFYRTDSRTTNDDGGSGNKDKGESKDSPAPKEKKDAKEPAAAKATNGSGSTKQPAASGASSTGGAGST